MSIKRKLGGVGLSATLLASLFATAAAPVALGATSVSGFGTVVQPFGTATSTSGPISVSFTENTAGSFGTTGAGSITVAILDKNGASAGITLTGTPTVTAPGYAGVTASLSGNTIVITSTGPWDTGLLESLAVGGVTVRITSAVPTGAMIAQVTNTSGDLALASFTAGSPASGLLLNTEAIGSTALEIALSGSCAFVNAPAGSNYFAGTTDLGGGTAGAVAAGQQTVTLTTGLTAPLAAGTAITQSNACAATVPFTLTSPGTVVAGTQLTAATPTVIQPGENNQAAATVTLTEAPGAKVIGVGTLTFTIAGGLFSLSPTVTYGGGITGGSTCSISFDRTSCTVSITGQSTAGGGTVTLSNIQADIAASASAGGTVTIAVAGSPTFAVTGSPVTVANISRLVVALAAQPTVFIGVNDQASGQISLTETQAGFFSSDPASPTNAFAICLTSGPDNFTRTPWAVVTAGNLRLAAGSPIAPATQAAGTSTTVGGQECFYWNVYTSSTTASTIEIRGTDAANAVLPSGANNGVRLSIGATAVPGVVQAQIYLGETLGAATWTAVSNGLVGIATRAFQNQPVVAAVSQPTIPKGATNAQLGNLTITETQAGQFKPGEVIQVAILPRSTPGFTGFDTLLKTGATADMPVATTNSASGLLVSPITVTGTTTFQFTVNQQATGTLGQITISNIRVFTLADAINGPILLRVTSTTAGTPIDQVVSNGTIGAVAAASAGTALGITTAGPFTTSTKVTVRGRYVTYRFDLGAAAAGKPVKIWGATKVGTSWTAFTVVTTRIANSSGVVFYYIRQSTATWRSYRAQFEGGNVWTPARQARWT